MYIAFIYYRIAFNRIKSEYLVSFEKQRMLTFELQKIIQVPVRPNNAQTLVPPFFNFCLHLYFQ